MKGLNLSSKRLPKVKKSKGVLIASDLRYLKNHALELTIDQWALKFNRTVESIRAILREHHLEVAKELKQFSTPSIEKTNTATPKPTNRYTETDLEFIKENIAQIHQTEMAKILGKNADGLRVKINRMGLNNARIYKFKPFTEEDIRYLQENAHKYSIQELADAMNRSFDSIEKKLRMMKLKCNNPRNFERLTEKQIGYIKKYYNKYSISQLGKKLNKTKSSIIKQLKKLDLYKPTQPVTEEVIESVF